MCARQYTYLHKVYFRIKTIACTTSYRCVYSAVPDWEWKKWSAKSCFIKHQFEHKIDYRISLSLLLRQNHHGKRTEDDRSIDRFIPMNAFTICHLSVWSGVIQLLFTLIRVKAKPAIDLLAQTTMHRQQLCMRLKWWKNLSPNRGRERDEEGRITAIETSIHNICAC